MYLQRMDRLNSTPAIGDFPGYHFLPNLTFLNFSEYSK